MNCLCSRHLGVGGASKYQNDFAVRKQIGIRSHRINTEDQTGHDVNWVNAPFLNNREVEDFFIFIFRNRGQ